MHDPIEDIIHYFASALFVQNTVEDVLWDIAKNCISQLGLQDCVIYVIDKKRNVLVQKAAYGPKNPKDHQIYKPIEILLGEGIVGSVAKTGLPEIVKDTSKDPRYILDDEERHSEITVPIKINDEVIGIIDSEHREKGFFKKWHLRTLELIATLCAQKIASLPNRPGGNIEPDLYEQFKDLKLTALDNRLNPHFLFNSLNAIQHFITLNDNKNALKYLSRFGKLIRKSIKQTNEEWVLLEEELELISSYLELEKLRSDQNVSYKIQLEDPLHLSMLIPNLLIHPIVDNLFNQNKSIRIEKKQLTIKIMTNQTQLSVVIDFLCKIVDNKIDKSTFAFFDYQKDKFLSARINMLKKQLTENFKLSISKKTKKESENYSFSQKIWVLIPQIIDKQNLK